MRTITIDIINEKVLCLLKDLEFLKLIRLRKDKTALKETATTWSRYKGAMSKQPLSEVNQQRNTLRNTWE